MKRGFTLSEVLITLAIIGIVAALTIPSVISNYQQQEFKTGLKKAVSVLNEAIQTNIAQDGETPYENGDLFNYLQKHMSILKSMEMVTICDIKNGDYYDDVSTGGTFCKAKSSQSINKVFYTADGIRFEIPRTPSGFLYPSHETGKNLYSNKRIVKFIEMNAAMVTSTSFEQGAHCGSYGLNFNSNNTANTPCIIIADVNGDKKPSNPEITANGFGIQAGYQTRSQNIYSLPTDKKLQDVFSIMITDEKAIPFGVVAQRAMYSK